MGTFDSSAFSDKTGSDGDRDILFNSLGDGADHGHVVKSSSGATSTPEMSRETSTSTTTATSQSSLNHPSNSTGLLYIINIKSKPVSPRVNLGI